MGCFNLQATCRSVADESGRLRDMNAVLGELLLSDELVESEYAEAEDEKDMAPWHFLKALVSSSCFP